MSAPEPAAEPQKPNMPSVTPAQLLAALTWVVAQIVANAWIDPGTGKTITQIGGTVIPAVWVAADSILRWARNMHHAKVAAASAAAQKLAEATRAGGAAGA